MQECACFLTFYSLVSLSRCRADYSAEWALLMVCAVCSADLCDRVVLSNYLHQLLLAQQFLSYLSHPPKN
jgi:hypothetical protein